MKIQKIRSLLIVTLGIVMSASLMTGCSTDGVVYDNPVSVPTTTSVSVTPVDPDIDPSEGNIVPGESPEANYLDHVQLDSCTQNGEGGVQVSMTIKNTEKGAARYATEFSILDQKSTQVGSFLVDVGTQMGPTGFGRTTKYQGSHGLSTGELPKVFTCRLRYVERVPVTE